MRGVHTTASRATEPRDGGAIRTARASGVVGLLLIGASVVLLAVTMALGPSAAVPAVGPGGPMLSLAARPSAAAVITLERLALLMGAAGMAIGLVAVQRGWRPAARLLLGFGIGAAAVYVCLPPAGSIDVLNYAVYGRIANLGHNPYLMRPSQLYGTGDPVGRFAPLNWRTLPTIYGPVATSLQWAAAKLGGASMARIVFWIRFGNAIAYTATAAGLVRLAGQDSAQRARACLLWAVNPLMLFWLVGSGHVDVLLALLIVAGMITVRHSGVAAGALTGVIAGAAAAIKTPFLLVAGGLAWAARRSPRTLAAGFAAAAAVLGVCWLVPGALNTSVLGRRLSVSAGFIYPVPASIAARPVLFGAAVALATLACAALLVWRLPAGSPGFPAVRPVVALTLAWLTVFPVQAPWYDALIFPPLALMPWSRLHFFVIIRCVLLSEMLLPGVLPNSGPVSIAIARISHIGLALVLGILIVVCVCRAWGGVRGFPGNHQHPARQEL